MKKKNIIHLIMASIPDQRLLSQFLEELGYCVKLSPTITIEEWLISSVVIIDEIRAQHFGQLLLTLKRDSGPLFVPIVILLPKNRNSLPWLNAGFDDVLRMPLQKAELIQRLSTLMRIRTQSETLIASEKKYRELIEYLPYGILIQSEEKIVFANQRMLSLLAAEELSQLIGKPFIDRMHPDYRSTLEHQIQFVINKQQVTPVMEEALLRLDGQIVDVEVRACPVNYENKPAVQFIINDISARVRAEKQITHMAYHDPLTDLFNRAKLEMVLGLALISAKRDKKQVAVIFFDLDRFKSINDSLGHTNGDIFLREVAVRLKNSIRKTDMVSRVGGDEFVIVLTNISDSSSIITSIVDKIKKALAEPIIIENRRLFATASMGISIYPEDGVDVVTLIKNADIAMYAAKQSGNNKFKFCTPALAKSAQEKNTLETQIRDALKSNEFQVLYQPKIDIKSKEISGVEALLRWRHPTNQDVLPSTFISLAEETSLITPMTEMVFTKVCQHILSWRKAKMPPMDVAINLSGRSFIDHNFTNIIMDILKKYNIDPDSITLEITEGILIQDIENNAHLIQKFKDLGMKISIDDFGTGYSSLNYLKYFIIDSLKIDVSFVRDITTNSNDALIVCAIIAMAHSLKIKVIAEGVETKAQYNFLKKHACDEIQGFYFSKPLLSDELISFMKHRKKL